MSKVSSTKKATTPKISPKELQKKCEELTKLSETLKIENEELKLRLRLICQKIVDNTDMRNYQFLDPNIEPDKIETKDLLHMLQTLALLATKLNTEENGIENHVENLEIRITELLSEQGSMFKNKLKLQERLEFIMQERDVWKRNAETLKKMFEKLAKEHENLKRPVSGSSIIVGAYKQNIDPNNQNQRIFSANIPRSHYETVRKNNIDKLQLETVDLQLIKQLSQIKTTAIPTSTTTTIPSSSSSPVPSSQQPKIINNNNNNNKTEFSIFEKIEPLRDKQQHQQHQQQQHLPKTTTIKSELILDTDNFGISYPSLESFDLNSPQSHSPKHRQQQLESSHSIEQQQQQQQHYLIQPSNSPSLYQTSEQSSLLLLERPMTSSTRKNVSFNSAIDIRTFPKTLPKFPTTNRNINEFLFIEDKQLAVNFNDEESASSLSFANTNSTNSFIDQQQQQHSSTKSILVTNRPTGTKIENDNNNNSSMLMENFHHNNNNSPLGIDLNNNSNNNDKITSLLNSLSVYTNSNNSSQTSTTTSNGYNEKSVDRRSICSKKKLPGETPVKELEKALKMVIIKELSVDKVDDNDWKMFAKRVGITDNEIKDWVSLRLQFPMARVLSVWSSKPEATVRLLHRHLSAPCFNYTLLAKRIETFYDVL